ncbi:MAG TPA: hypothetical protein RMH99_23725 [Sandaracinaceae bacterium LLY-WYZ-13_1]|nr:hypothetical protein [Sandaracinaceae bacterium LLY-WYZ-13_1]
MTAHRPLLARAHDAAFSDGVVHRVERAVIAVAFLGFLLHVGAIAAARWWPAPPAVVAGVGTNFLGAIYTPFSVILFYEVLLLVAAFAEATSRQMALQFEIITLIVIRRVFKDFGAYGDPGGVVHEHAGFVATVATDLGGSVLLVLLTALFHFARRRLPEATAEEHEAIVRFKKSLALVLGVTLVGLVVFSAVRWVEAHSAAEDLGELHLGTAFYGDFFMLLILMDVLVLVRSWRLLPSYGALIRNSGFVISTILLRLAMTSPKPEHLVLANLGVGFSIAILVLTALLRRVTRDGDASHPPEAAEPVESEPMGARVAST